MDTRTPQQNDLCSSTFYGTRVWPFNSSFAINSPPKRVYICSGGSSGLIDEIEDVDLFIFGEPKESAISTARDRGLAWQRWAIGDRNSQAYGLSGTSFLSSFL